MEIFVIILIIVFIILNYNWYTKITSCCSQSIVTSVLDKVGTFIFPDVKYLLDIVCEKLLTLVSFAQIYSKNNGVETLCIVFVHYV